MVRGGGGVVVAVVREGSYTLVWLRSVLRSTHLCTRCHRKARVCGFPCLWVVCVCGVSDNLQARGQQVEVTTPSASVTRSEVATSALSLPCRRRSRAAHHHPQESRATQLPPHQCPWSTLGQGEKTCDHRVLQHRLSTSPTIA